jgi:hypothetical protein
VNTSASRRRRASVSSSVTCAFAIAVISLGWLAAPASGALPPGYTIEPLVPPGEAHSVSVRGLEDDGSLGIEVSRGSTPNTVGNVAAYHRSAAGVWRQATIPAGNNQINQLGAIGPDGTMYGTWRFNNNIFDQRMFISSPGGAFTDVGRLNNNAGSLSNTFVGAATGEYASMRTADVGYTYRVSDGQITVLPPIRTDGPGLSTANGASDELDWFVGISPQAAGSNQSRATLWRKNASGAWQPTNLGLPAGAGATDTSTARNVSDAGAVVGWTGTFSTNDGFFWTEAGGMQVLPRAAATNHFAYDVNSDNLVVGYRGDPSVPTAQITGVIWDGPASNPVDLRTLVQNLDPAWQIWDAQFINDAGQIMGRGAFNGVNTTFLLTPVPEPAALSLAAATGGALLLRRRRTNDRR